MGSVSNRFPAVAPDIYVLDCEEVDSFISGIVSNCSFSESLSSKIPILLKTHYLYWPREIMYRLDYYKRVGSN